MEHIKIGLMEFGFREPNLNSLEIISEVIEYAQHADRLGFSKFWLPEHHIPVANLPWTDPTLLIGLIAASTESIQVGAAGIMLGIHQSYHIASAYKMLSNLFPNRIDLGLANGQLNADLVELIDESKNQSLSDRFAKKMQELCMYYNKEDHVLELGTVIPPYKGQLPRLWSLTTNMGNSLEQALEFKTNLARSIFHKGADRQFHKEILIDFKKRFFTRYQVYPETVLVLAVCIHKTEKSAQLSASYAMKESDYNFAGTATEFYDTIMLYKEKYAINEFVLNNVAKNDSDRLLGIELISEAFELCSK